MTTTTGLLPVTDDTFDELVLRAGLPVLLEFTASWCPPCRMIEPVLRELAGELAGRWWWPSSTWTPTPRTARAAGVLRDARRWAVPRRP
jgi:thioredoxin 1